MNVWVEMARGCASADPYWLGLRAKALEATSTGRVIVPLSPAHYLELWHRRSHESRRTVATLMRDVSQYSSIPSPHVVRQLEAEKVVNSWAVNPLEIAPVNLIGRGAAHAFGRPDGRLRMVENVASPDGKVPEGRPTSPPEGWERFRDHPDWEWFQLFGLETEFFDSPDLDRTPEHRVGLEQLEHELRVRSWLTENPRERRRLKELVTLEEYGTVVEYVNDECVKQRVDPPAQLRRANWDPISAQAVRDLIESMPSSETWATLRYLKHRDLNLPWEQHDWTDIWALSVAIPYCDAVITEKRWAHFARIGALTERFGTNVGHGRDVLEEALT